MRASQHIQVFREERTEEGWATEPDLLKRVFVRSHTVLDAIDFRVSHDTIDGKAVAHAVDSHVSWNSTVTEDREHFVVIVRFNDLANVPDG